MKGLTWTIVGIIVVAAVGFGGYKLWHHFKANQMMQSTMTTVQPSMATPSGTTGSGLPNKDTSNQQLNSDVQNIQGSLNNLQQQQNTSSQDVTTQSQDTPQQY